MKHCIIASLLVLVTFFGLSAQRPAYRGYYDTGFTFGGGGKAIPQWHFRTTQGVDFIDGQLFAGLGAGVGISTNSDEHTAVSVPVYANARYTFGHARLRPFADLKGGYAMLWNKNRNTGHNQGGFYFSPSAGVSLVVGSGCEVNFGVGYTLIRAHYESGMGLNKVSEKYNPGGITLHAGVSF